jgi:hypothetical protein
MNTIHVRIKKICAILLLLAFVLQQVQAQNRGGFTFAAPMAAMLKMPGGRIYTGGGPGGVAFENMAIPAPDLTVQSLSISYDPSQPDGSRMKLTINGQPVKYPIFDWELAPVAKFANSSHVACFTYFGELTDKTLENAILDNNGHILNYHADLFNTLLGWRLSDMDLLIMYDFTTDLPKASYNEYYLGGGEKVPDVTANNTGLNNYLIYLNNIKNSLGYIFRSYVIGDYKKEISISIKNDSLKLSGYPYYYCWRFKQDFPGYDMQHVADSISARYTTILQQKKLENPNFYERGLYIDSLISIGDTYSNGYQFYESGTFVDMVSLSTREAKRVFLEKYNTADLNYMLVETSAYLNAYSAVYLKEFSDRMSNVPDMISAANPAVWHATVMTMRASAFFRYVKKNFPVEWQTFINQVAQVQPKPAVSTPTVMYATGNGAIVKALKDYNAVAAPLVKNDREILFYPNPVKEALTVENLTGNNFITVSTVTGEKYIGISMAESRCTINTRRLTPGLYVLQITNNDRVIFTQKIIKAGE